MLYMTAFTTYNYISFHTVYLVPNYCSFVAALCAIILQHRTLGNPCYVDTYLLVFQLVPRV